MNAPLPLAAPAEVELKIECSDGVRLSARVIGPAGAPRLVMSHGNGLAIDGYRSFWMLLADEFQVVVFDMRGHGRSDAGSGLHHNWSQFYDDMEALRQQLDHALGAAPAFGVFHSLSAVASFGHRRRYGPCWEGLVLFDPPFMPPDGHPVQALHLREMVLLTERVRQRRRRYQSVGELARQFARQPAFRRWRAEAHFDMALATLVPDPTANGLMLTCAPEREAHIYDTNSDPTLWRWFGAADLPILLVCSDPDALDAPPSAHGGRAAAAEFGVAYQALPNTSHFLQIEQPEACADLTRCFCRSHLPRAVATNDARAMPTNALNAVNQQETTMIVLSKASQPVWPGNIVDYLFEPHQSVAAGARTFLTTPDGDVSFDALFRRTCRVGNLLRKIGIAPGDRVLFSVLDGIDFPAIFLGAIKIGATSLPLNTFLTKKDYAYYIKDSAARVVIVGRGLAPMVGEIVREGGLDIKVYVTGGAAAGFETLEDALKLQPETLDTYPRKPDEDAFWLYSSGSTGDPKGVVHTHAHIFWSTELFGFGAMNVTADDVIVCPPKFFFAYGLGWQLYMPLRAGARVITEPAAIRPDSIVAKLIKHQPTLLIAVPTLFAGMLDLMRKMDHDAMRRACSRLRFCVSGGEVLAPSVLVGWRELTGIDILDGVGTTEMTHMFMINRPGQVAPGSCGRLVEGYTAKIVDENWNELPQGEIGNLFVIGPTAARTYWNKPEKTAATMRDGGVLTGDKCYLDDKGNYFYVGRYDDMLRVGGIWVSPAEIESTLAEHPEILESAVIGVPDENLLIKPMAFVVLRPGTPESAARADEITALVRAKLAHYKCPRWIKFVNELPKTATGKIQRFRLRDAESAARPATQTETA